MGAELENGLTPPFPNRKLRLALVSLGIGRVQRGFERLFTGLYDSLQGSIDVTLFKSDGAQTATEKVPSLLWPVTHAARKLPLSWLVGSPEYNRDCFAYSLTFLPELLANRFDVVHHIDPPLAPMLAKLRSVFRFPTRLVMTDGCVLPHKYYAYADHIHQPGAVHFQRAVEAGMPLSRMTLIPLGMHTRRFMVPADRAALRRKHGVSDSTFVIVAVSAVKRLHKRVDHLIDEAAQLPGDILLWIDGNPEDESVCRMAAEKLGKRCRITHLPSDQLPELFKLSDVMVHAALEESFGLAIAEALCSGVMVLAHDGPHFEWLTGDRECLVDMTAPGRLAERLRRLSERREFNLADAQRRAENTRLRFDWEFVTPEYVKMYERAYAQPARVGFRATSVSEAGA